METKTKIVFIDDEKQFIDMYTLKLKQDGFRVFSKTNGEDGLEAIKKHKPDLVILDVIMMKGDGFFVMERMKKSEDVSDIPVIVFSNLGNSEDKKEFLRLGAREYLVKMDYTPTQLSKKVKEILMKKVGKKDEKSSVKRARKSTSRKI